jgi:hypothetical protein
MAEDPVVNTGFDPEAGRHLIEALDRSDFPLPAAFWLYNPYANEWKLWIATPLVDQNRLEVVYGRLYEIARTLPEFPALLSSIILTSPKNDLILQLKSVIRTGPSDIAGIRFTQNVVNGVYIEDAYIYRLALPS